MSKMLRSLQMEIFFFKYTMFFKSRVLTSCFLTEQSTTEMTNDTPETEEEEELPSDQHS